MSAFTRLRRAEQALAEYRAAGQISARLRWLFVVAYGQIVILVLLMSIRLAFEAAGRITGPIGRLANAAQAVREGDLDIRVELPESADEVRALTQSFNQMTEQLDEQRSALVSARIDAEDRRNFLETLLSEVSAGVIRTDASFVVTIANRSACQLLGDEDLEGRSLNDIAPQFAHYAQSVAEHGYASDASLDVPGKDGLRYIRLKVTMDPSGGFVLTFDDATRLVNAQRQLAWRDVARRIAHEIRNPLTPIQLSAERLRKRYASKIDDSDGVFERCVSTILRQVDDIGRMVEEFSGFARMPKPTLKPFNLSKVLDEVTFSQQVVSPDLSISLKAETKDIVVLGDERLLAQAFGNIVKNATEAVERTEAAEAGDGLISLQVNTLADQIEILIEDNGPGFPEAERESLLEPYVTTREKGTGLGLAIVNRIIMDHGGSIALLARPDGTRGALVRVVLPRPRLMDLESEARSEESMV